MLNVPFENTKEWFAVYTFPRHEKKVTAFLTQLQIRSFCPLYSAVHRWKQRKATVKLPLFPGYAFVNISREQQIEVLSAPGVVNLVSSQGKALALPSDQIETLEKSLTARRAEPHPLVVPGRTVRVRSGPLAGLEGVVLRRKGQMRMVVSLTSINQSIVIELEESDLAPIVLGASNSHFAGGAVAGRV